MTADNRVSRLDFDQAWAGGSTMTRTITRGASPGPNGAPRAVPRVFRLDHHGHRRGHGQKRESSGFRTEQAVGAARPLRPNLAAPEKRLATDRVVEDRSENCAQSGACTKRNHVPHRRTSCLHQERDLSKNSRSSVSMLKRRFARNTNASLRTSSCLQTAPRWSSRALPSW